MKTVLSALCAVSLALAVPAGGQEEAEPGGEDEMQHRREPNGLAQETSPYLRQHMYNPVDWYPWGAEAIEKARAENKPIFLSIGYSACHWCHVMERESFEDEEIAAYLNEHFVSIKVDREERPDLDEIYMAAVQQYNDGRGGWPMSVFLTPGLDPFFGGTYFPPKRGRGRVGFDDLLRSIHESWTTDRDALVTQGERMVQFLNRLNRPPSLDAEPAAGLLTAAIDASEQIFDPSQGGFGSPPGYAPKFPHSTQLVFLLRHGSRTGSEKALRMVEKTLREMARGGIYDQVAGGFHRYSVDRSWTVPHFEKMLYDNAQLASVYMEAWQATGKPLYRRISREILDYVEREMVGLEGGFYSTTDADSEGEEGTFFVWSEEEFRAVVGEDADLAVTWFGVSARGNFEGHNIPTARADLARVAERFGLEPAEARTRLARAREALYVRRETRVHPLLDDKILSSWNGLMLSAFARASAVFGEERYVETARRNASFLLGAMRREDGGLFRTRREGRSHLRATLEDYAFVVAGLLDLYEADLDVTWLAAARELHEWVEAHFADAEGGGYYSFSDLHEDLPVRTASAAESSLPSDIGVTATNAARLGLLTGEVALIDRAWSTINRYAAELNRYPVGYCQLLILLDFLRAEPREVYLIAPAGDAGVEARADAYLGELRTAWPPYRVFTRATPDGDRALRGLVPALAEKGLVDGKPTVYVCLGGVCEAPVLLEDAQSGR